MSQARRGGAALTGVRDGIAKAFNLFSLGRRADEPQILADAAVLQEEIAAAARLVVDPVSGFAGNWVAMTSAQIGSLQTKGHPTRVELGAVLLSLDALAGVIDLQLARHGLPDHCASCESPHLAATPGQANVFECLACGLQAHYSV